MMARQLDSQFVRQRGR